MDYFGRINKKNFLDRFDISTFRRGRIHGISDDWIQGYFWKEANKLGKVLFSQFVLRKNRLSSSILACFDEDGTISRVDGYEFS